MHSGETHEKDLAAAYVRTVFIKVIRDTLDQKSINAFEIKLLVNKEIGEDRTKKLDSTYGEGWTDGIINKCIAELINS